MSQISHFQVYSQRENHVTNNTLLMLRHVYRTSPLLLEGVLHSIIEDEGIEVGPRFVQQKGESDSIPDARISQDAFHLYVEAKPFIELTNDQVERHLKSISNNKHADNTAFLLVVSRDEVSKSQRAEIVGMAREHQVRAVFTTYAVLIAELGRAIEQNLQLQEILDDFTTFIGSQGLIPDQHRWLVAMLSGDTWSENARSGVYFEPATRNGKWASAKFFGLYHSKTISHVGRIVASVTGRMADDVFELQEVELNESESGSNSLSENQIAKITQVIRDCKKHYGDFAAESYRYYIVDEFAETNLTKDSRGGLMGHRYIDLSEWCDEKLPDPDSTGKQIADLVRNKKFDSK